MHLACSMKSCCLFVVFAFGLFLNTQGWHRHVSHHLISKMHATAKTECHFDISIATIVNVIAKFITFTFPAIHVTHAQ